jgi:hypothetical protein
MVTDRCRQVIGDSVFGGGEDLRAYRLGSTLQVGEYAPSRGLVSAIRRDFDDEPVAIAISCDVRCRFVPNPLRPILADSERCSLHIPSCVAPSSEPRPLTNDNLGIRW